MPDRDRLSALDAAFLDLDTARAPLHVGWTIRLDGPAPTLAALRRHLDRRLDRVPRFRRRVVTGPLGAGRSWADDPGFDIARHVHAISLPAPGGPAQLRELAGTLLSTPLDPGRPLWRLALVDGLADEGWAIAGQAHHALVDGMAALQVAALLFDAEPDPAPDPARSAWRPQRTAQPLPDATGLVSRSARGAARAATGAARRSTGALQGPAGLRSAASTVDAKLRDAAGALDEAIRPAPQTVLDRSATARRVTAFAEVSLDAMREAGSRHGGTVNDALLTACTLALGRALRRRGARLPASLKCVVPVDVRTDGQQLGNAIGLRFVELPVRVTEPADALAAIAAQTVAARAAGDAGQDALTALVRRADGLPETGRGAATRALARSVPFNLVISNVPGPRVPLYLLGRRVQIMFPAVPFLDGHALSIGALSYCGRVGISLYADAEVLPDVVDVTRDIESALDALRLAWPVATVRAPPRTAHADADADGTPWGRRARERRGVRQQSRRR